jgi:hypothetical protein
MDESLLDGYGVGRGCRLQFFISSGGSEKKKPREFTRGPRTYCSPRLLVLGERKKKRNKGDDAWLTALGFFLSFR